jgi:hypothetical protein
MGSGLFEIEVLAPEDVIPTLALQLERVSVGDVAMFQRRGRDGDGILGIAGNFHERTLKLVWKSILSLSDRSRVKFSLGDLLIEARDVHSFEDVMRILAEHGVLTESGDD